MKRRHSLSIAPPPATGDGRLELERASEVLDAPITAAKGEVVDEMPATIRYSEEASAIIEGLHNLTLEVRAGNQAAKDQKDKTALPNWIMPLICAAFIGLITWVFNTSIQTIQKDAEKLERRLETQETWMKNTREQLIAHGWTVDDQGNIHAVSTAKK